MGAEKGIEIVVMLTIDVASRVFLNESVLTFLTALRRNQQIVDLKEPYRLLQPASERENLAYAGTARWTAADNPPNEQSRDRTRPKRNETRRPRKPSGENWSYRLGPSFTFRMSADRVAGAGRCQVRMADV